MNHLSDILPSGHSIQPSSHARIGPMQNNKGISRWIQDHWQCNYSNAPEYPRSILPAFQTFPHYHWNCSMYRLPPCTFGPHRRAWSVRSMGTHHAMSDTPNGCLHPPWPMRRSPKSTPLIPIESLTALHWNQIEKKNQTCSCPKGLGLIAYKRGPPLNMLTWSAALIPNQVSSCVHKELSEQARCLPLRECGGSEKFNFSALAGNTLLYWNWVGVGTSFGLKI